MNFVQITYENIKIQIQIQIVGPWLILIIFFTLISSRRKYLQNSALL